MSTKIHNKLVRDKIPEIIAANGQKPVTKILNDEEYLAALIAKLDEEVAEFKADHSLEELADIQEVILALADEIADTHTLETVCVKKREVRGAFKHKIFLEGVRANGE